MENSQKWTKFFVNSFLMILAYIFVLLYDPCKFIWVEENIIYSINSINIIISIIFLTSKCMCDESIVSCDYYSL